MSSDHKTVEYWLKQSEARGHRVDAPILSEQAIAKLNASMSVPREGFHGPQDLLEPLSEKQVAERLTDRMQWLREKFSSGEYIAKEGKAVGQVPWLSEFPLRLQRRHRVAVKTVQLYCAPTLSPFFEADTTNEGIDKNRCSAVRPQELLEVLAEVPGSNMLLARSAVSWGFIEKTAAMSPTASWGTAVRFAKGPFFVLQGDWTAVVDGEEVFLPARARLPGMRNSRLIVATQEDFKTLAVPTEMLVSSTRVLTRRALLSEAFSYLNAPYGFGGKDGGIDCSSLVREVFASFGLQLPRHSSWQAKAGSYSIDVSNTSVEEKLRQIDRAEEDGIVLLHLPGHIMLYLGRDVEGTPMVLHALAHYLVPCTQGETSMLVDRVQVSGLELGKDSSKGSLLERIDTITVFGSIPRSERQELAEVRPAAPLKRPTTKVCQSKRSQPIFLSPKNPQADQSFVRAVTTSTRQLGPVRLAFFGPKKQRVDPVTHETNGPPRGYLGSLPRPSPGRWMVALGDGGDIYACRTFRVRPKQDDVHSGNLAEGVEQELGPAWEPTHKWTNHYEELYAVFVERLFDYPADEDRTWPNLHVLMQDSERNILINYLGSDEDAQLKLDPDCADLPYTLRAYFAWKLGLPYGMHICSRAKNGRPPTCQLGATNLVPLREAGDDDTTAFLRFFRNKLRRTVHSSSGRTRPDAETSDFYPVPLKRAALRPGTLFTDPFGHLLVVVKWNPQGHAGSGALLGADAQPDGTIGRRRFWRGSFLFRPETKEGGAGFKAFRPWQYDPESNSVQPLVNNELRNRHPTNLSNEQYRGTENDFYDKMERLINPRPLDPLQRARGLVDALHEQVVRRKQSVENGEAYMGDQGYATMNMPDGASIFLTTGPWEDFSTPSRDWRLLIAIHTVLDFPDAVRRSPEQYGISKEAVSKAVDKLKLALTALLKNRRFTYTRSDGSAHALSLQDIVDRRRNMEMAYNPNDCVEVRWGASPKSNEYKTCKRRAPEEQQRKMEKYRPWFAERSRPAQ